MRQPRYSHYLRYLVVTAAVTLAVAAPASARALTAGRIGSAGVPTEHQMQLVLAPRADRSADAEYHIGRDLMVYRLRAEAATSARWSVSVIVSGGRWRRSVKLTSDAPEITLPRPLGLFLHATDTLFAVATFDAADSTGGPVTLHIEYEPADRFAARLPVRPVRTMARVVSGDSATWHFTAEVSGRILALAGLPLKRVRAIALVDAASGITLWSTTVNHGSGAYCPAMPRLGALVEAGRSYRVLVELTDAVENLDLSSVVAMVLPAAAQ